MSPKSCATTSAARAAAALFGAVFLCAIAVLGSACEDKAIGRPCDVQSDAGAMQAVFNGQALECPSRICIKPAAEFGVPTMTDKSATAPYCTAECSKDSDCDGERRDPSNTRDKRCKSGFVCGVGFEVGPLCCRKLCLCRDFIAQTGGLQAPASCDKSKMASTCQNL